MKHLRVTRLSAFAVGLFASAFLIGPSAVKAQQTWNVNVGAESPNEAKQANAFLPNEVWIHAGDSITWTAVPKNEPHTVTFLTVGQIRPGAPPPFGPPPCPPPRGGTQPSGSSYNGSACVTSGPLSNGATYTVTFPTAGNYKLVCLFHADMNGTVHVLPITSTLPHNESFYEEQASSEARDLLTDSDHPLGSSTSFPVTDNEVTMKGEVAATPGGRQYLSIVRFLPQTIQVHVGDTVEWVNSDPTEPHTVTFGTEPSRPTTRVNVTTDADGALDGTIGSATDSVSSGFLQAAPQDRTGLAQSAPGTTRIRITFTHAGTYHYICALHDVDGMVGTVQVLP